MIAIPIIQSTLIASATASLGALAAMALSGRDLTADTSPNTARRLGLTLPPVAAALGAVWGWRCGLQAEPWDVLLLAAAAMGVLVTLATIDARCGLLPNRLNLTLALLGLAWAFLGHGHLWNLASALFLGGTGSLVLLIGRRWRGVDMIGMGDIKFLAMAGLWLPPWTVGWYMAGAGVMGVLTHVVLGRLERNQAAPFGPALCTALILALLALHW
ncbi:MAG: prepilin peptidase [Alphaproteobacteria bacterium]|nr:MAG: prepilin peptidase [Alphaproteobacteria bacterium]